MPEHTAFRHGVLHQRHPVHAGIGTNSLLCIQGNNPCSRGAGGAVMSGVSPAPGADEGRARDVVERCLSVASRFLRGAASSLDARPDEADPGSRGAQRHDRRTCRTSPPHRPRGVLNTLNDHECNQRPGMYSAKPAQQTKSAIF